MKLCFWRCCHWNAVDRIIDGTAYVRLDRVINAVNEVWERKVMGQLEDLEKQISDSLDDTLAKFKVVADGLDGLKKQSDDELVLIGQLRDQLANIPGVDLGPLTAIADKAQAVNDGMAGLIAKEAPPAP